MGSRMTEDTHRQYTIDQANMIISYLEVMMPAVLDTVEKQLKDHNMWPTDSLGGTPDARQ